MQTQIRGNGHTFEARLVIQYVELIIGRNVQRDRRTRLSCRQGELRHQRIRQHGDFVPGHVHRG